MYFYGPASKFVVVLFLQPNMQKNRQFVKLLKGSEIKGLFVCIINHLLQVVLEKAVSDANHKYLNISLL